MVWCGVVVAVIVLKYEEDFKKIIKHVQAGGSGSGTEQPASRPRRCLVTAAPVAALPRAASKSRTFRTFVSGILSLSRVYIVKAPYADTTTHVRILKPGIFVSKQLSLSHF